MRAFWYDGGIAEREKRFAKGLFIAKAVLEGEFP